MAMLSVTKMGNDELEDSVGSFVEKSLFECGGDRRIGYYSAQGGSEEMIIHAVQRSLLSFQKEMEEILAIPQKEISVNIGYQIAAK